MSAKLLWKNDDGTMPRLEVFPSGLGTRVVLHTNYWDEPHGLVPAKLEFLEVAAIGFGVNYADNPIGAELCGLYELTDEGEKERLLQENFHLRRRDFLQAGYALQEDDPDDALNCTAPLEQLRLSDYHMYEQQALGGVYRILARSWRMKND